MLDYIREAKTPKKTWGNLKTIFAANTTARKLQLHRIKGYVNQQLYLEDQGVV